MQVFTFLFDFNVSLYYILSMIEIAFDENIASTYKGKTYPVIKPDKNLPFKMNDYIDFALQPLWLL